MMMMMMLVRLNNDGKLTICNYDNEKAKQTVSSNWKPKFCLAHADQDAVCCASQPGYLRLFLTAAAGKKLLACEASESTI